MKVQLPECQPETYQEYAFVGDSGFLQVTRNEEIVEQIRDMHGDVRVYTRTVEATYWPWTEISENDPILCGEEEFNAGDRICLKANDEITGTVTSIYEDGMLRVRLDKDSITRLWASSHVRKIYDGVTP